MNKSFLVVLSLVVQVIIGALPTFAQDVVSIFGEYAPRRIAVKFAKANDLVNKKQINEAVPIVNALLKEAPKLGAVRFLQAKILYKKQQFEKSYGQAKLAVTYNPKHGNSYITLGNSALAVGKKQEALNAYQRYLQLCPNSAKAANVKEFVRLLKNEMAMASKSKIVSPPGTYLKNVTIYGVTRFTKDKMPLKVFIHNGSSINGFRPSYTKALKESFSLWQTKSGQLVSFKFVGNNQSADIECHWTDNVSKLVTPLEGGHSRFSDSEFGRVAAEIVILVKRNGKFVSDQGIKRIALHEIGHSIGLNGHSNSKKDIMFMTVDATPLISDADIKTLKALYQLKPTKPKSNIGGNRKGSLVYSKGGKHQAIVLFSKGNALLKQKKFSQAVLQFRQAIKIDPGFKGASYNLSVALNGEAVESARAGKMELAIKQLEESIKLIRKYEPKGKKMAMFLKNYKIILTASGKTDEAKKVEAELSALNSK